MVKDVEDNDEEVYGDLGPRNPLQRVSEEALKESGGNESLPGIKALFGVAAG